MKKKILFLTVLAAIILMFFPSCQENFQPDQATGNDNNQADNAVADVFFFAQQETTGDKALITEDTTSCPIITRDTENLVITTTIDFNNCDPVGDGVIRDGKIIIRWEIGWMINPNKRVTITFDDFKRNNVKLEGELSIQFDKETEGNSLHQIFKINEKDMKLSFEDNTDITWNGDRTVVWYAGFSTPRVRNDNIVEVSYTRNGTNRKGEGFTAEAEGLYFDASCQYRTYPLKGTLTITKDDGTQFTIDFGNGECDNCVTYSSGGNETQICGD